MVKVFQYHNNHSAATAKTKQNNQKQTNKKQQQTNKNKQTRTGISKELRHRFETNPKY